MNRGEIFRVMLDAKRRPTLPQALLDAAGVGAGENMVAHLAGPGRIVLEAPAMVLSRLQEAVRTGRDARSVDPATANELPGELADESAALSPDQSDFEPEAGVEPDAAAGAGR